MKEGSERAYSLAALGKSRQTICWDCANACGACSWSARFEPVKGWEAVRKDVRCAGKSAEMCESYWVVRCPEFRRDAENHGTDRITA